MSEETTLTIYTLFKAAVFLTAIVCLSIAGIGWLVKKLRSKNAPPGV